MNINTSLLKSGAFTLAFLTLNAGLRAQDEAAEPNVAPAPAAESAPAIDEKTVVLTVDETPITVQDVRELFTARYGRQFENMRPEERQLVEPQVQQMVISELVSRVLLINAADEAGYKAEDEKVQESLSEIEKSIPEGMTLDAFATQAGITVDRIKSQIVDEMKIRQVVDKVTGDVSKPEETEVKQYFEEHPEEFSEGATVDASHILISTQGISDEKELDAKKAQADELYGILEKSEGKNFADLAREHSDCPSKEQGGQLGEFTQGRMVPEFETAAFSQPVGTFGKPVKTQFGWHIIQVNKKDEAKQLAYADVKEELTDRLFEERKSEKMDSYVNDLREAAKIERPTDGPLSEAAVDGKVEKPAAEPEAKPEAQPEAKPETGNE